MPVTFLIPGPLRPYAEGKSYIVVEPEPATLAGALEALWKLCPGIRDRIITEQSQIREHINVFVGNENVRYTGGLQTPVPDGAEITIMPAISGGSASASAEDFRPFSGRSGRHRLALTESINAFDSCRRKVFDTDELARASLDSIDTPDIAPHNLRIEFQPVAANIEPCILSPV